MSATRPNVWAEAYRSLPSTGAPLMPAQLSRRRMSSRRSMVCCSRSNLRCLASRCLLPAKWATLPNVWVEAYRNLCPRGGRWFAVAGCNLRCLASRCLLPAKWATLPNVWVEAYRNLPFKLTNTAGCSKPLLHTEFTIVLKAGSLPSLLDISQFPWGALASEKLDPAVLKTLEQGKHLLGASAMRHPYGCRTRSAVLRAEPARSGSSRLWTTASVSPLALATATCTPAFLRFPTSASVFLHRTPYTF